MCACAAIHFSIAHLRLPSSWCRHFPAVNCCLCRGSHLSKEWSKFAKGGLRMPQESLPTTNTNFGQISTPSAKVCTIYPSLKSFPAFVSSIKTRRVFNSGSLCDTLATVMIYCQISAGWAACLGLVLWLFFSPHQRCEQAKPLDRKCKPRFHDILMLCVLYTLVALLIFSTPMLS